MTESKRFAQWSPKNVRRDEERALISSLDALGEGRGGAVELAGEPGSGKTLLLTRMVSEARRRGQRVAHVRSGDTEQRAPYRVFAHVINGLSSGPRSAALTPSDCDRLAAIASDAVTTDVPAADREALDTAVRALLTADAADGGRLLVLDDFHWADEWSARLIARLVGDPVDAPLLIVVSQRQRQADRGVREAFARGTASGAVRRVELAPLSPGQSAELLELAPDSVRLRRIHREGDGVPLYLLALAAGDTPEERLSAQATGLLLGEIATLSPRETRVASAVAVLGDGCDAQAVATVAGQPLDQVRFLIRRLVRRDVLRPGPKGDDDGYTFRHPVLRRVVYTEADPTWRVYAHQRALNLLTERGAPVLSRAVHAEHALPLAGPDGLAVLRQAAAQTLASDPEATAARLRTALDAFPEDTIDTAQRADLTLTLARALSGAGRLLESRDLLHEVMRLAPEQGVRAEAVAFCALIDCMLGRFAEARALISAELSIAFTSASPPAATASLIIQHGVIGALGGHSPNCDEVSLALRLARRHQDRVAEAGSYILSGLCDAFNVPATAHESLTSGSAIVDELPDAELAAHPEYLGLLAWGEMLICRFDDARRHFERGMTIAGAYGHGYLQAALLVGLGNIHRHTGRQSDARRFAVEAKELAERSGAEQIRGVALALEALAVSRFGPAGAAEALALAEEAVEALRTEETFWNVSGAIALTSVALLNGEPQRCTTVLLEAGRGPELPRIPAVLRPQCFAMLAAAAAHAGEPADEWAVRAELAVRARKPLPVARACALIARGQALRAAGRYEEAAKLYLRAAGQFAERGMICNQAMTLWRAARLFAGASRRREADEAHEAARVLARRCDVELQESTGPGAEEHDMSVLTDRELEIAEIASTGKKTREIAEELSLSPRTVDVHLTRVYRKLDIASRPELARLMAERRSFSDGDLNQL